MKYTEFLRSEETKEIIGAMHIERVPAALVYEVRYQGWDSPHSFYVGTIFPLYRDSAGNRTKTLVGWEVSGEDRRFDTLEGAAAFLSRQHIASESGVTVDPDLDRDWDAEVDAAIYRDGEEWQHSSAAEDAYIAEGYEALGWR